MRKMTLMMGIVGGLITMLSASAWAAGDPEIGKQKAGACFACHNVNGVSTIGIYPNLAGQYEDYLFEALKAYKSKKRQDPVMFGMAANLSEEDMADLAAYFSSLKHLNIAK